jgi:dTDP-4-amino-4,6-dideoxygalactose transaminase
VAARYTAGLAGLPVATPRERAGVEHVYHQYAVRTPHRDALRQTLTERGIGTGIHYPLPLHVQEGYRRFGYPAGTLPVSERAAAEVLSLPMSPFLGEAQVDEVIAALRAATA